MLPQWRYVFWGDLAASAPAPFSRIQGQGTGVFLHQHPQCRLAAPCCPLAMAASTTRLNLALLQPVNLPGRPCPTLTSAHCDDLDIRGEVFALGAPRGGQRGTSRAPRGWVRALCKRSSRTNGPRRGESVGRRRRKLGKVEIDMRDKPDHRRRIGMSGYHRSMICRRRSRKCRQECESGARPSTRHTAAPVREPCRRIQYTVLRQRWHPGDMCVPRRHFRTRRLCGRGRGHAGRGVVLATATDAGEDVAM